MTSVFEEQSHFWGKNVRSVAEND